jgi:hypothetical protein
MSDHLGVSFAVSSPRALFENRLFVVPDYQRGYAWERQQWLEFVEDIDLLPMRNKHYTGTVVLQASPAASFINVKGKPLEVFEVVDGQQRLTTLVLLADAIRRVLIDLGESDFAEGISETFLFTMDRNRQLHPKLKLGIDASEFFSSHILQEKPWVEGNRVRSHINLEKGKAFFTEFLVDKKVKLGEDFGTWLLAFTHKVSEQLILTVYPVGKESDAGIIFEALNNRGKPITELEKAKNYLLYLASKLDLPDEHHLGRLINETWAFMFQRLMSSGLANPDAEDQLLRAHWLMAYDPAEKNYKGNKSLRERFNLRDFEGAHEELLQVLMEYVGSLRHACTAFCDVFHPRHPDAFKEYGQESVRNPIVSLSERLPRLRVVAPFIPLLIGTRLRFSGDPTAYMEVVERCERYAFRVYRLLQRRSQTGRSSLFQRGHQVYTRQIDLDALLSQLDGLTAYHSRQADFDRAWEMEKDKNWYSWSGLRYLLYEYETHLSSGKGRTTKASWAELEKESLDHTIEHVLPQTPTDSYWRDRFDSDARARCTHDLGNLCLTLDNSAYGNKPFPLKRGAAGAGKRCYAEGDLLMERELAGYEEWTEQAVRQRREKIVEWARMRWGIEALGALEEVEVNPDEEASLPEIDLIVTP